MKYLIAITLIFATQPSWALFETLNSAEPLALGKVQATGSVQSRLSGDKGLNFNGHFDLGYKEDADVRAVIGFGKVDFHFGGFYKWAPIPDVDKQPAMAILGGFTYASDNSSNQFSLRAIPIASKRFDAFNPFVSLPIGYTFRSGDDTLPIQLTVGTGWQPPKKPYSLVAELGLNLNDAFTHVSVGFIWNFESLKVRQKER